MKSILERIFSTREEPPLPFPVNASMSSELSNSDVEHYYWRVIVDCLERLLVSVDSIEVGVERSGTSSAGLTAFVAFVRILKWDPDVTPVLLQNMSVIDARIRQVVNASFILEHTEFKGIWFQASCSAHGAPQALLGVPVEPGREPRSASAA